MTDNELSSRFWALVEAAEEKKMDIDLSNDIQYQFSLNQLGGEQYLKEHALAVYDAIVNTRKNHQNKLKASSALITSSGSDDDTYESGFKDDVSIDYIYFDINTELSSLLCGDFNKEKELIAVMATLNDVTNNEIVDSLNYQTPNSNTLGCKLRTKSSNLLQSPNRIFSVKSTFVWSEVDSTGKRIVSQKALIRDNIKYLGNNDIVKNVIVKNPDTINNPSRSMIIAMYGRDSLYSDPSYDYKYPEPPVNNKINIKLPFEGSIELAGMFQIQSVDRINLQLKLNHKNQGSTKYNKQDFGRMHWEIINDPNFANNSILKWNFDQDWKDVFDLHDLSVSTISEIKAEIPIIVKLYGEGTPFTVSVVVTSDYEGEPQDKSIKKIKKLEIVWGCMSKDTLVLMSDGCRKSVAEIKIGDKVKSPDGLYVKVLNIYTGTEETLVSLETESGKRISVTHDHPIATKGGIIAAGRLCAADLIQTEGGYESVKSLYTIPYNDKVYSLQFETSTLLVCNEGIIAGDFNLQQDMHKAPTNNKLLSAQLSDFQKEFSTIMNKRNQI